MSEIVKVDSIQDYHEFLKIETLHPLVSAIDLSEVAPIKHVRKNFGFYSIILKDTNCGDLRYGRKNYDYQEGTLVFIAPGQIVGDDDNGTTFQMKGWGLFFHPDLLQGTSLGKKMKNYSFFSYEVSEALHMSEREREIIINCFREIREELHHSIDKHSRDIITSNIEVFLNHCVRFYDRQFVTRKDVNKDVLSRFEELLSNYFTSDKPQIYGLPTVSFCADQLHLSANYFGDLIKKETGKSAQEYIQFAVINKAKDSLSSGPGKSVSEIAYELGFKYPHHLSRVFKKVVGCTPNEYRSSLD